MRAVVMNAPGEVVIEDVAEPIIEQPTDAIIKLAATCICGSDLWPYRGAQPVEKGSTYGHEYVGVVEEIGADVKNIKVGDFVVGSFVFSCGECRNCQDGYPSKCIHASFATKAQAEKMRVPFADGTLVATPSQPDADLIPHLLAASDVLGTGWFAADEAQAGPGKTVVVVGDGAVGLSAILAAKELGAERIIAMSRNPERQKLAKAFGATDIVEERGEEGIAKIKEMTDGYGADSVVEAVGTQESMMQAIHSCRGGGHVGYVGVSHGVKLDGGELFFSEVHLMGGPAAVRKYLPTLIQLIFDRKIEPGKVFNSTLPFDQAAEGYRQMDQREAIKVMLEF